MNFFAAPLVPTVFRCLCVTLGCAVIIACTSPDTGAPSKSTSRVDCIDPRPQICHKMRRPVCATRDNGVRCVTTPCDSTEEITYANECLACADPAVYAYREGACGGSASDR